MKNSIDAFFSEELRKIKYSVPTSSQTDKVVGNQYSDYYNESRFSD